MQPQPDPLYAESTDLERERMNTIATRRALYQAQRATLDLLERDNERDAAALVATVQARLAAKARAAAEDEAAAKAAAGETPRPEGAEVVELRPGGPVATSEAPAAA